MIASGATIRENECTCEGRRARRVKLCNNSPLALEGETMRTQRLARAEEIKIGAISVKPRADHKQLGSISLKTEKNT